MKLAMGWRQNPIYSHFQASPCLTALPTLRMVLDSMWQCMDPGEEDLKMRLLMWGFLIPAPNQIAMTRYHPYIASTSKRRKYVREIEHATFTPLVLSTTGGMGRAATTFSAEIRYSTALNWIRCRLSFALLRASIMSISGARSSRHHTATEGPIDLQLAKAISTNSK